MVEIISKEKVTKERTMEDITDNSKVYLCEYDNNGREVLCGLDGVGKLIMLNLAGFSKENDVRDKHNCVIKKEIQRIIVE